MKISLFIWAVLLILSTLLLIAPVVASMAGHHVTNKELQASLVVAVLGYVAAFIITPFIKELR